MAKSKKEVAEVPAAKQAPRTNFELAKTPRERLEIAQGGNSIEYRPVHPSDVENKIAEFCKTYNFKRKDLKTDYNEMGLSLKISW